MLRRSHLRLYAFGVLFGLSLCCLPASARDKGMFYRKYKPPPPTAQITVSVLRSDNDSPIPNAAVIFHPIKHGKDQGGLETKSDRDGKATITVIPIGDTVLVQIIANGYQTYGKVYKIDQSKMAMKIRLKLPQPEYSVYKNHNATANSGQGAGTEKAAGPAENSGAAPSQDKPSDKPSQDKPSQDKSSNSANEKPSGQAKQDAQNDGDQAQTQQK